MNKTPFHKWLLWYLEEYNLTNEAFAEWVGVCPSAISHYLKGRRSPTYDTLQLIINATGVNPNVLF